MSTQPQSDALPFLCSSKLMQNYTLESPVSATGQVAVAQDKNGNPAVFAIGSAGDVFCYRPDSTSDTGWSQTPLGLQASQISVGLTADGNLLVASPAEQSGENQTINYVEENSADGTWGPPQQQDVSNPSGAVSHVKLKNVDGRLYLAVFASGDAKPPYGCYIWDWTTDGLQNVVVLPFAVDSFKVDIGKDASGNVLAYVALTPQLYVQYTSQFQAQNIYWTKGAKGEEKMGIWRPVAAAGYSNIGDYAVGGDDYKFTPPGGGDQILTVKSVNDPTGAPLLAPPSGYEKVWSTKSSGDEPGAIWKPVPPDEYASSYNYLGHVASNTRNGSATPPATDLIVCVRSDFVSPAQAYVYISNCEYPDGEAESCNANRIYASFKSRMGTRLSVDRITPAGAGADTYAFYAHADWSVPTEQVYTLNPNPTLSSLLAYVNLDAPQNYSKLDNSYTDQILRYSTAVDGNGLTQMFAILSDQNLYFYDQTQSLWARLNNQQPLTDLSAVSNSQGQIEVYAIGTDENLYYIGQDSGSQTGWTSMILLENDRQVASVATGKDSQGDSRVIVVTRDNLMYEYYKAPASGEWSSREIELQATDQMNQVSTYMNEITVLDGSAVPAAGATVSVWADDEVPAAVNGLYYLLNPSTPVTCKSNLSGLVTIIVETNDLTTPLLKLRSQFMPDDDSCVIQPNVDAESYMKSLTGEGLYQATNLYSGDGVSVLEGQFDDEKTAANIASGLNNAMNLIPPAAGAAAASLKYPYNTYNVRGIRYIKNDAGFPHELDVSSVPEQYWQMDFTSGKPVFRTLRKDEAEDYVSNLRASYPAPEGVFDWIEDLGDLVREVIEGVKNALSATVTTLQNGLKEVCIFIEDVVNDIKYTFSVVLQKTTELIHQVFDFAELILAKVQVYFEKAFEWLAFIFNWDDIARTHDAIKYTFNTNMAFLNSIVGEVRAQVDAGITNFQNSVTNYFEGLISELGGDQNVLGLRQTAMAETQGKQAEVLHTTAGTNIILSGTMQNLNGAQPLAGAKVTLLNTDPIVSLIDTIAGQIEGEVSQATQPFQNAVTYFSQVLQSSDPDVMLRTALAGVISTVEGVVNVALAVAKGIVDALCDAVQCLVQFLNEVLNEEWGIPYVSYLYKTYISPGNPLTIIDLTSLVLAIPTTVAYKLIMGVAPFPAPTDNNDPVKEFESQYTLQYLQQLSGLGGPGLAAPQSGSFNFKQLAVFSGLTYALNLIGYGVVEAVLDAYPPATANNPVPPAPPEIVTQIALYMEWGLCLFSIPWVLDSDDKSGFGCNDADSVGNLIWALSWITPALDTLLYVGLKSVQDKNSLPEYIQKLKPTILRNGDTATIGIDAGLGAAFFGLFVWQDSFVKETSVASSQAFFVNVPNLFKLIRLPFVVNTYPFTPLAMAGIDGVGDVVSGILEIVEAVETAQS